MFKLCLAKDTINVQADYVLDSIDKFYVTLDFLTPKFEGKWVFLLIDPSIAFTKELVRNESIPDWVDIYIQMSQKKINEVTRDFPNLAPKERTRREEFNDLLAGLTHLVDKKASKLLYDAYKEDKKETTAIILKLDKEVEGDSITAKQIQGQIIYNKHTYASDVINSFLLNRPNRWQLYDKLIHELGLCYAFYACRRYVNKLLEQKELYLQNKDVSLFAVKFIDAPSICFAYVLFANATNYKQLYAVMYNLQQRDAKALDVLLFNEVL